MISVVSDVFTDARMVTVWSIATLTSMARDRRLQLRQGGADAVHRLNDVGARLAEDNHQHGRLAVGVSRVDGGLPPNLRPGPRRRPARPLRCGRRSPAARSRRPEDLIVGAHLPHVRPSEKWPFGRVGVGAARTLRTCSRPMPYLFSSVGFSSMRTAGQRTSAHDHLAHAAHLRQLLRHDRRGRVVHLALA